MLIVLTAFISLQVTDGIITWYGINHIVLGVGYEANPLAILLFKKIGINETLILFKSMSILFGFLLYIKRNDEAFGFKVSYYLHTVTVIMALVILCHLGVYGLLSII